MFLCYAPLSFHPLSLHLRGPERTGRGHHLDHQGIWLAVQLLVLQHLHQSVLDNAATQEDLEGRRRRCRGQKSMVRGMDVVGEQFVCSGAYTPGHIPVSSHGFPRPDPTPSCSPWFCSSCSSRPLYTFYLSPQCSPFTLSPYFSRTPTWPVRRGLCGSEMSYCRTSPCSQLLKYRKRSSRDSRISVIKPRAYRCRGLVPRPGINLPICILLLVLTWHFR